MDQTNRPIPQQQPTQTPSNNCKPFSCSCTGGCKHKKVGPIVVTLVIVLALIIVALYFFASRIDKRAIPADDISTTNSSTSTSITTTKTVTPVTSTKDDVKSLENDLNTSIDGVNSQSI